MSSHCFFFAYNFSVLFNYTYRQQTFVQMLSISRKKEKQFKESKSHSTKSNSVLSKVIKSTPTL